MPLTITVRLIPAVYRLIPVELKQGEPATKIAITSATVSYPALLDKTGQISADCRAYVVEQVRAACARDGFRRCINWPPSA